MYLLKPRCRLSVVIPTSDDDHRLGLALEGYAAQTFRDFEVHIVNDGGSPATAELVDRFRNRLDIYYHYHNAPGRYHPASARNLGIAQSCGLRTVLSDCDVIPCPNTLAEHDRYGSERVYVLGIRRRIPRVVTENIIIPQHHAGLLDTAQIHRYPWRGDQRMIEAHFYGAFKHLIKGEDLPDEVRSSFATYFGMESRQMPGNLWKAWLCWSFNVSFPGNDHRFNPGFDCNYGYEDLEFALRMIADGYRVVVNQRIVAYHLDHVPRAPESAKQNKLFRESLRQILERHR